jgi:hypothetical protein
MYFNFVCPIIFCELVLQRADRFRTDISVGVREHYFVLRQAVIQSPVSQRFEDWTALCYTIMVNYFAI